MMQGSFAVTNSSEWVFNFFPFVDRQQSSDEMPRLIARTSLFAIFRVTFEAAGRLTVFFFFHVSTHNFHRSKASNAIREAI